MDSERPLRNRVSPLGEILAVPERGLVYGNRGCLHDAAGRIVRPYAVRRWISCRLEFKDRRRRPVQPPGRYTGLFFLDEATALAAGHRPCAECRRADYDAFRAIWRTLHPADRSADDVDRTLHAERWAEGQRRHTASYADLPDASLVARGGAPWLVLGSSLRRWSPAGYPDTVSRPVTGTATVLTPPSLRAVLAAGWSPVVPLVHPSAAPTVRP